MGKPTADTTRITGTTRVTTGTRKVKELACVPVARRDWPAGMNAYFALRKSLLDGWLEGRDLIITKENVVIGGILRCTLLHQLYYADAISGNYEVTVQIVDEVHRGNIRASNTTHRRVT